MASSAKTQSTPRRGRPPRAVPHEIALVALELFEREGYEQVTMDEVADAASVSRRTLFRLFPSKSDLVWEGLKEVLDAVKQKSVPLSRPGLRLDAVVDEVFAPVLSEFESPKAAELARRRLKLIAATPMLLNHQTIQEIESVIHAAIANTALPSGASPSLVARTLAAAMFAALLWWAEHGEGQSPVEVTRAALRAIALAQRNA